jgi:hypothetical protein
MNSAALAAIVATASCVSTLNELTPQELQERRLADSGLGADDQRCALDRPERGPTAHPAMRALRRAPRKTAHQLRPRQNVFLREGFVQTSGRHW